MSDDTAADNETPSRSKALTVALIAGVIAVACALAAGAYWWLTRNDISTDDAFIKAHILQVAPRVDGHVARVLVDDNEHVNAGQPLFALDKKPFETRLAEAKAQLASAKADRQAAQTALALIKTTSQSDIEAAKAKLATARAQASKANRNARRYRSLYKSHQASEQRSDEANTNARVARHRIDEAKAQLARAKAAPQQIDLKKAKLAAATAGIDNAQSKISQAKLNLSYTEVDAPHAGRIAKKSVVAGSQVGAGQSAMALVESGRWVIANFKETQLARMRIGQPVSIEIDAFPDQHFSGHVQSIQPGTGPTFSLLPPENATGNYVKIVKRVPVKIVFDHPGQIKDDLAPGMSVVPTVHVPEKKDDSDNEAASAGG